MDVAGHAPLRHPQDDLIALLFPDAGGPRQVQVAGAGIVRGKVGQGPDAQRVQGFIIALDQLMPPLQQAGIALQLLQTYGGHDVRHVALIPRPHDVVLPRPQLGLGQSVLGLSVEAQQLIAVVQLLVVKTRQRAPRRCTALGGSEVLHGVEGEGGEVCQSAGRYPVAGGAQPMGAVGRHGHPAQCLLHVALGAEQCLFPLHRLIDAVIVAGDASQIHRDHRLGLFGDGPLHLVIVHLQRVLLAVDELHRGPHMDGRRRRGGIGVRRHQHLVAFTDAQHPQVHLLRRRSGVQAHQLRHMAVLCQLLFQLLGAGAGGDPAGPQGLAHLLDLQLRDIRRAEGYISHIDTHSLVGLIRFVVFQSAPSWADLHIVKLYYNPRQNATGGGRSFHTSRRFL